MDESCPTNYTYISCCIIIVLNLIYLGFTSIKVLVEHRRRQRRQLLRRPIEMTDNNTDIATSRVTTRSVTAAAAAAAAAASTSINTTTLSSRGTSTKTGQERLAQLYPHIGDDTRLPSKWNSKDKATSLTLQQNDLVVTYKG